VCVSFLILNFICECIELNFVKVEFTNYDDYDDDEAGSKHVEDTEQ
jgi:hypothetical protein